MQGMKLYSHKRFYESRTRKRSFDSEELKLPIIHISKHNLVDFMKLDVMPSQRSSSMKQEKENSIHIEEELDYIANIEPVVESKTYSHMSIEGVATPQHIRPELRPRLKRPSYQYSPIKSYDRVLPVKKPFEPSEKQILQVKEWAYGDWLSSLQISYGLVPVQTACTYKFYIGKGNNSPLVNQVLKTRWWWARVDCPTKANLVWTQLKHKETLKSIGEVVISDSYFPQELPKPRVPRKVLSAKTEANGHSLIKQSSHYFPILNKICIDSSAMTLHNHLPHNGSICCKKSLFKNMKRYYIEKGLNPFDTLPLTFHVGNMEGSQMQDFLEQYRTGSTWIVKPGEGTNRGNGIKVSSNLNEIQSWVSSVPSHRSLIIQKYIEKPFLVHKRKFDIRCYGLVTCIGPSVQCYFYREGYIRTACKEFSLRKLHDKFVHLTNDAVQKKSEDYGKHEMGNKMSYAEFSKYLACLDIDFYAVILPQIERIVTETFEAVHGLFERSNNTFEVFGYDFMIDEDLKVWLLEVNSNPCLELSCSSLARIIPAMLDNAFNIAIDPIFPPPFDSWKFKNWVHENEIKNDFSLVFAHSNQEI